MTKLTLRKKLLLFWLCLHYAILLLSYSSTILFNHFGSYDIKEFWPVVEYAHYKKKFVPTRLLSNGVQEGYETNEKEIMEFYGIFSNYDTSEFLTYSLLGIFIFSLSAPLRQDEKQLIIGGQ